MAFWTKKKEVERSLETNWYFQKDVNKSVRQVVLKIPSGNEVEPQFGILCFASKYQHLMSTPWATGLFRMESNPGPFLLVRADSDVNNLRGCPIRVCFSFYQMVYGGLFSIFVDVDCPSVRAKLTYPHVLFEIAYGLDMVDCRERIYDAINKSALDLCFAGGSDSMSYSMPDMDINSSAPSCEFDVKLSMPVDCRKILNEEWRQLLTYHNSIPEDKKNFQMSMRQFENENPQMDNPILENKKI